MAALTNILGHDNRGDRPIELLLMADWGELGMLDSTGLHVMKWRNGALSGSELAHESRGGYHEDIPAWREASPSQA